MTIVVNPQTKRVVPMFSPWRTLTALIVNDVSTCYLVQEAYLRYYSFQTQVVTDGQEAVDLLATGARFDLIIIDKLVPSLNGVEVVRLIREMGVSCKIVGYYGVWDARVRDEFMEAGADEFYQKPLRTGEPLTRIIREIYHQG